MSNVDELAREFDYRDWYFFSEGDSDAVKFNSILLNKIKESHRKLEDQHRRQLFELGNDPVQSFREYVEFQRISPLDNYSVFYDITPEYFIKRILLLTPIQVRDIGRILYNKYNFENVKDFYKDDAKFFQKCSELLKDELSSCKNIKGKLCAHFLEGLLDEFQRIHEKLS